MLTGAVAGLATITPAAGYITPMSAMIIGIVAGIVCYFAVSLKHKMNWDDALDVWGVHGVGGIIGVIMTGLFATSAVNPAVVTKVCLWASFRFSGATLLFSCRISLLYIFTDCFGQ